MLPPMIKFDLIDLFLISFTIFAELDHQGHPKIQSKGLQRPSSTISN